jgi:large subunit ribosomal protein L10
MPKTRIQKNNALKKISEKIGRSKSVYFAKYSKLTVADSGKLRTALRNENSEFVVAPKTITNLALTENKLDVVDTKKFEGQMAVVFGYDDEVTPAKILNKFKKENENKIEFLGGILDGKFYSSQEVAQLAELPGKTELLAKLVGSLNSPISGFVNVLAGNLRNLVYVLKAIEETKV